MYSPDTVVIILLLGLLWDLKSPKVALNRLGQKTPKLTLKDKLPHFNILKTIMN